MPRSSEQLEHIRKEKKKLIMDVALELFAENGFHATSISQITKKASISKGLIYNYFTSKNEILEEIIDQGFLEIHHLIDPSQESSIGKAEFTSFLEKSFDLVKNNLHHWKLYFSLMLQPVVSENFTSKYAEAGEPMFKLMYQFILDNGSKDPDGDLMVISAMIEGAFLYAIVAPVIFPIDTMKEKIITGIFEFLNRNK